MILNIVVCSHSLCVAIIGGNMIWFIKVCHVSPNLWPYEAADT